MPDHGSHRHEEHGQWEGHGGHANHHEMMVRDFRRRFFVSLALTVPMIALSPTLRGWFGLTGLAFPGDDWALLGAAGRCWASLRRYRSAG